MHASPDPNVFAQNVSQSPCRLCLQPKTLRKSHIVPEFLYRDLYNSIGHMMGITGKGTKGWTKVQKGLREPLFCDNCEQLFNDQYEKPFLRDWIQDCPLAKKLVPEQKYLIKLPSYDRFRLFHLSILFRASVSSCPTYKDVKLAGHEDKIRKMLLNNNPGENWKYLLIGYAVIHDKTHEVVNLITRPEKRSFDGVNCFSMIYGGVEWWTTVVSHKTKELEGLALRPDGSMSIMAIPWNSIPAMQKAKLALNERI